MTSVLKMIEASQTAIDDCRGDNWTNSRAARALASSLAAIEKAVPSDHSYRKQAQIYADKFHEGTWVQAGNALQSLRGVLDALAEDIKQGRIRLASSALTQADKILIDLDRLLADIPRMRKELMGSGDFDSGTAKKTVWMQKCRTILAKHFGGHIASQFFNKVVWTRAGRWHSIRDFDDAIKPFVDYVQSLRDDVEGDPASYGGDEMTGKYNLVALSFNKEESTAIDKWAGDLGYNITVEPGWSNARHNNIVKMLNDANLTGINGVDGFVVADSSKFKPEVLAELNQLLFKNNSYLFATNKGPEPYDEDELKQPEASGNSLGAATVNVYGNVGVVNAGIARDIKQITNNIQHIQQALPELANGLESITDAIKVSELPEADKEQALERVNELSAEIAKPPGEQKGWKLIEKMEGLQKFIETGSNLVGTTADAFKKIAPYLPVIVDGISKLHGGS